MRIAFDMSSVIWTCLQAGTDPEALTVEHGNKTVRVNTRAYGYENVITKMTACLQKFDCAPKDCILVFEGMQSKKLRLQIDPTYKVNRGERPDEAYIQFQELRDQLESLWRSLGALAVTQNYVEGDDILGYLAAHTEEELVVVTGDGDLAVLNGVNAFGGATQVYIGGALGENKYGPFPHRFITLYKALVGDSSDNIKGCPGFGPASWIKFYTEFDDYGCDQLLQLCESRSLEPLAEDAETNKFVKMIFDNREAVVRSYRLAKIYPEWVNTVSKPLVFKPGVTLPAPEVVDERLAHWYGKTYLVLAPKMEAAIKWAQPFLDETDFVGLDIETSTPDESDDWLAEQNRKSDGDLGVDVIGSKLTGLSLTFGKNLQHTLYFPIDHAETLNCSSERLCEFIYSLGKPLIIHNAANFELPVLGQEWEEFTKAKGLPKFLPNALDTRIEVGYVNENLEQGLKFSSRHYLGYEQVDYKTITTVEVGKDEAGEPIMAQKKMRELTAKHVLSYAADDAICCAALHNFCKLHMQLEHHYQVYLDTELDAMYLGAQAFLDGVPVSLKRLNDMAQEDQEAFDKAWAVFRDYLITQGWEGTIPPVYGPAITASEVKDAYEIVTGREMDTKDRKLSKLAAYAKADGEDLFAAMLEECASGVQGASKFTAWVQSKFNGEPLWKNSPQKKAKVLYEMLNLPVRLRNAATDIMRKAGITEGNPKTDALALAYAIKYDSPNMPEVAPIIHALQQMQVVLTRQGLYYKPYPTFVHWKTGRIHPSVRQSSTNTRRHTAAKVNVQQMSKHPKADGETPKVREVIVPHKKNAVVVSFDFKAQELRVIADYSKDQNMVSCFVGDNKKDMHALTALGIIQSWAKEYAGWSYEVLIEALDSGDKTAKEARKVAKVVNFSTEYGAMAPKVAETLLVTEGEAQTYIDAKEAAFPGVRVWKDSVEDEARRTGMVRTMGGAVRHLADAIMSEDRYESSKAYRQAVNFKVQSSSAEMTKQAHGQMWREKIRERFDCVFYFPVHDESVWSCSIEDLFDFIPAVYACMTREYGGMTIPIESSISFGKSFGPADQIEIGDKPTREAIQAGLDKMLEMA